jgi:hypothetical protein
MISLRFFWPVLWFFLGALLGYAFISMRRKLKRSIEVPPPQIDEDDIRRIEEEGVLLTDDPAPLDLEEIKREEDEFWRETWDEAEEV